MKKEQLCDYSKFIHSNYSEYVTFAILVGYSPAFKN